MQRCACDFQLKIRQLPAYTWQTIVLPPDLSNLKYFKWIKTTWPELRWIRKSSPQALRSDPRIIFSSHNSISKFQLNAAFTNKRAFGKNNGRGKEVKYLKTQIKITGLLPENRGEVDEISLGEERYF
ncbi:MAG: hypothetical protein OIF50_12985 [Flavobacteriaceae bacterium]|nr:hypothetical protein [Flavobacteriaceae bacterium]